MHFLLRQIFFRYAHLCLVAAALPVLSAGQVLRGRIADSEGRPIPFATVYVREMQLGTSADEGGAFELKLPRGVYTCVLQRIGYQTSVEQVEVTAQGAVLRATLADKAYALETVVVSNSREDYAYHVMRRAIAMAPYYRHEVSRYKADVYLKGTCRVNRISRVVKALAKKELRQAQVKENETYLLESMNEIEFSAPNTYKHKVLSTKSTVPVDLARFSTMNYVNVNVYSLNLLAHDAISSYRFAYEGIVEEGNMVICKIKVTPRKKNPGLLSGYLYIVEDTWRVYSANLSGSFPFGAFTASMATNEIRDGVWLPTSYNLTATVKALGNNANFDYTGTIRYESITKNTNITNPLKSATPPPPPAAPKASAAAAKSAAAKSAADSVKRQKRRNKLASLLEQEELSNREMMKASKLFEEELKQQQQEPPSLNLSSRYRVEVDSGSHARDSAYWNAIRPVPLKRDEVASYLRLDSVRAVAQGQGDSARQGSSLLRNLILGKRYQLSPTLRITHSGLVAPTLLSFSAVNGFHYGQRAGLRKMLADSTLLNLNASVGWAFSRKACTWRLGGGYQYIPERRAEAFFSVGWHDADYNDNRHVDLVSSALTLLLHNNYNRLYDQRHVTVGNNIDLVNGLSLQVALSCYDRSRLENSTEFSLFNRQKAYAPNLPDNRYAAHHLELRRSTILGVSLSYTPQYFYRMRGRQKRMAYSSYPTFRIAWREGIPGMMGGKSDFSVAKLSVHQTKNLGLLEEFFYRVEGVKFFRSRKVDFPDFHHFSMPGYVAYTAGSASWEYSRYYRYSTPTWGAWAEMGYTTSFLALKFLPLLEKTYCRENVSLRALYTPQQKCYTEAEYAVSEIFFVMRLGIFAGFENEQLRTAGVTLKFNI
ncbi:MAG: DUF5686 and carboxypeptidase regulatory-like domain-containing protein [Prevotellaceae bacterium]|jgi:hypothetical protein|nr:DUF5686 and carboxypeptidase regulatory-like domain-containing protein [Prevotellaceae bacterium]